MPRKNDRSESNKTAASWNEALESEGTKLATPLRQTLQADLYRYTGATGRRAFVSAYLHEPGFRFTYYLRKVAFYSTKKSSFGIFGYVYNRLFYHHYRFKYAFEISPAANIGPGLYIRHFGCLVISPHAVLDPNVTLPHGAK